MELCEQLDRQRIEIVKNICEVLNNAPIVRAWIFGSFARQEERPDSDIDILVDIDPARPIGLLAYTDVIESLENATGRKVDLVANGSLKPFARESVERDKVLVYERAS
ncbi:MAG: nucleotidyltransferase domain-containing protein [Bacteroidales bacterium]|nr:nucleotidyltransferase domain-containing protein [Bacteroidales bacterium]